MRACETVSRESRARGLLDSPPRERPLPQTLVLTDDATGRTALRLETGTSLLGRGAGCALRQDHAGVSSRHALLCATAEGFYVADQSSTNGTWVNGQRVETAWLREGDTLRLGPQAPPLRVSMEDRPAPPGIPVIPTRVSVPPGGRVAEAFDRAAVTRALKGTARDKREAAGGAARYLVAAGVIGGLLVAVMLLMLLDLGPAGLLMGGIVAFLPAPLYVTVFLWLDRYDPEPRWALAGACAWGALVSIFISAIGNTVFGLTATALSSRPTGEFLTAVISAPLVEEGTKGLGLLLLLLLFRRYFDGVVDGLVYAGLIALGFATVENVQYYGRGFLKGGVGGVIVLAILRGGLSPFAHAFFTCMTGIGCGIARESHRAAVKVAAPVAGFAAAVLLHSAWNFVASRGHFFTVYFLVWVPLFFAFLGVIAWLARRERLVMREMLRPEVAAGLLTQQQLDLVSSLFARIGWTLSVLGDRARYRARRDFLDCAARLALCYWHVVRASQAGTQTMSLPRIPQFRAELQALSAKI